MTLLRCSALHLSRFPVSPFLRVSALVVSILVVSILLVVSPLCSSPRRRHFRPPLRRFRRRFPPSSPSPPPPPPRYFRPPSPLSPPRCCFHCLPPHLCPRPPSSFPPSFTDPCRFPRRLSLQIRPSSLSSSLLSWMSPLSLSLSSLSSSLSSLSSSSPCHPMDVENKPRQLSWLVFRNPLPGLPTSSVPPGLTPSSDPPLTESKPPTSLWKGEGRLRQHPRL